MELCYIEERRNGDSNSAVIAMFQIFLQLDFPAKESLITPVVEYHAVPSSSFNRHVCVQLPHALPEEFNVSLIKVKDIS